MQLMEERERGEGMYLVGVEEEATETRAPQDWRN